MQNYFTLNVLFVDVKDLKTTNISYSRILCHAHEYFAISVHNFKSLTMKIIKLPSLDTYIAQSNHPL
jgi:hypothetical protein